MKRRTLPSQCSVCKPISALVSNVLSDNNEPLWGVQTVRHPVSHPVLHTVYQTNVAEQQTRTRHSRGQLKPDSTKSGRGETFLSAADAFEEKRRAGMFLLTSEREREN